MHFWYKDKNKTPTQVVLPAREWDTSRLGGSCHLAWFARTVRGEVWNGLRLLLRADRFHQDHGWQQSLWPSWCESSGDQKKRYGPPHPSNWVINEHVFLIKNNCAKAYVVRCSPKPRAGHVTCQNDWITLGSFFLDILCWNILYNHHFRTRQIYKQSNL